MRCLAFRLLVSFAIVGASASAARAQFLGTFPFQLAPYCNVVTLNVTQIGNALALDGFDDQCGGGFRGAVVGTAVLNPNDSIGIGLSIVSMPGATPVHIAVTLNLAKIQGPWQDSIGHTGTFVFNPPTPTTGDPLPGTGGPTGGNTAVGGGALISNTSGLFNTAVGGSALSSNTTGVNNTAVGGFALASTTTGFHNTSVGTGSLGLLTSGSLNTALGMASLDAVTTGDRNTGIGDNALPAMTSGSDNIALGHAAGAVLTSGSDNIYIGSAAGAASENGTIRIGSAQQVATFVAGIIAQSVDDMSDRPVLIDATGKLGTIASSARFKQDIRPLGSVSQALLGLEPVSFRYRPDQHRGGSLQYGLIAEQVAEVMPELVIRDENGQPLTVKYHILPTLLLAEIQRLERERAAQAAEIQELREQVQMLLQRDR